MAGGAGGAAQAASRQNRVRDMSKRFMMLLFIEAAMGVSSASKNKRTKEHGQCAYCSFVRLFKLNRQQEPKNGHLFFLEGCRILPRAISGTIHV
jgi:hypothetical protein